MELELRIADLLKRYNCVIVPHFGGFIASIEPAKIDENSHTIHPPYKQILFNANLTKNDGLLANDLTAGSDLSFDSALDYISEQAMKWSDRLSLGERIDLGEIGFLYKKEGRIFFEQNREINLLLQSYGLKAVQFQVYHQADDDSEKSIENTPPSIEKSFAARNDKQESKRVLKDVSFVPNDAGEEKTEKEYSRSDIGQTKLFVRDKRKKQLWKYAAAAAFVPFIFYSYWIPMQTDFLRTGIIQPTDFDPAFNQPERNFEHRLWKETVRDETEWKDWDELTNQLSADVRVYNYKFTDDLYIPVFLDSDDQVKAEGDIAHNNRIESTQIEQPQESAPIGWEERPFQLITGCFSSKSNATRLIKQLHTKGFQAILLDKKKGLHRVSAGGYLNMEDAKAASFQLNELNFSSWVLKR